MPRRRRPWLRVLVAAAIVAAVVVGGFGLYLASVAGELPWQEDPTRIPIEPFADIPGFTAPTPASGSAATPAP